MNSKLLKYHSVFKRPTVIWSMLVLLNLFGMNLDAQDKFVASGPKVVALGEQFQLSWEVNGDGSNFQAPSFDEFTKLQGPSTGSSSSVTIMNGKMERVEKYTYSYVLAGKSEGVFEIKPASIELNGKKLFSNSLRIEVVKGQSGLRNNAGSQPSNKPTGVADDDVYVRVELNKTDVFMGEQIVATLKVYSRTNQIQFTDAKFPQFDGFVSSEVSDVPNTLQRENVNNEVFYTGIFKKLILIPQRSGTLNIDPFELSCNVSVQDGYVRDFFGRSVPRMKTLSLNLKSKARSVSVRALPGTQPADFNGAVGQFELSSKIDKNQAKTNDAISLKITISGKGNIKLIEPLKISFPSDFDSFDPKISENIQVDERGSSGSKSFEYLLIPRYAGEFKIPAVTFSYFDIQQGKYVSKSTEEYTISVEKGEGDSQPAMMSGSVSKKDIQLIGKDIRYLKDDTKLTRKGSLFADSGLFWTILLGLPLLLLIVLVVRAQQLKAGQNVTLMKTRRATAKARSRLKEAESFLKTFDEKKFYEALLNALYGYFSDKLSIPMAELNRDSMNSKVILHLADESVIKQMNELLDTCEFSRYAPVSAKEKMQEHFAAAVSLVQEMDRKIKSPK